MGRILAFIGGARSGKSRLAAERASRYGPKVTFVATLQPLDDEMRKRVELHRRSRPASWRTMEAPRELAGAVREATSESACVLVDCLTLWMSNLLCSGAGEEAILGQLQETLAIVRTSGADGIFVSNEVGCGIVPENELARRFRDLAGTANQLLAREADEVYWVVCGKSVRI